MLTRKALMAMTAASGIAALPVLAFGQANTGGSSMMPQTTQTQPQRGPTSGVTVSPQGSQWGTSEQNPQSPDPQQAQQPARSGETAAGNPSGAATGPGLVTSGGTAQAPGAPPSVTGDNAAQRGSSSANPGGTAQSTAGAAEADPAGLRGGHRASKVIGATVYNENDAGIGSVGDLILPPESRRPVAILSVGGFLGIGAKLVAVPFERLRYDAERTRWIMPGATKESLAQLPDFSYSGAMTGAPGATQSQAAGGGTPMPGGMAPPRPNR